MPFWRPEPLTSLMRSDGKPSSQQLGADRLDASWRLRPTFLGVAGDAAGAYLGSRGAMIR